VVGQVGFSSCAALCAAAGLLADVNVLTDSTTDAHAYLLAACMLVVFALGQVRGPDRAAERHHPTGGERMVTPILQTLQNPILLMPWLCFRGGFPNPLVGDFTSTTTSVSTVESPCPVPLE
jgi:hypothetical protein